MACIGHNTFLLFQAFDDSAALLTRCSVQSLKSILDKKEARGAGLMSMLTTKQLTNFAMQENRPTS